ncbi:MAG TPA: argininosuccinate lyase [Vicinamibacterales bacterium]|nr:argininosuccinate lyase [Vicinamibacterales bacterium]
MTFDPSYVRLVLNQNFEDAKAQLLAPLMAIHYAHLVMLTERGIVSAADASAIRDALRSVPLDEVRAVDYDGSCEDLFFYVERLIVSACGEDIAGRLHTARSRNDIDMTMYRMHQRQLILGVLHEVSALRRSLIDLASVHRETVYAAHTHTQPAQASTAAHYLLAVVEQLERDATRLRAAYRSTNRNPLGACAITGTGFPIDRARTTELLGFDAATGNTYGSIATVDYLLESVSATAVLLAGLGRVVQDLLLWCTAEVGYLRLADGFVQSSSIMPQKRNPVALEHARALASLALGQTQAILLAVHNTPFGDIVDTEDDLQPLVTAMFRDAARATGLVAAAMATAELNVERMASRARQGWITVTELADTLTRDYDVAFRTSHRIAATLVSRASAEAGARPDVLLREITRELAGREIVFSADRLREILSPEHFVRVRTTPGGPAPQETDRAIAASRERLAEDETWMKETVEKLRCAEQALAAAAARL